MARILVALEETQNRLELVRFLENRGHEVYSSADLKTSLEALREHAPALAMIGEEVGGTPAPEFLGQVHMSAPLIPVLVFLKKRDATRAVGLLQAGAFDCVAPPWTPEVVEMVTRKGLRLWGTSLELMGAEVPKERHTRWRSKRFLFRAGFFLGLIAFGIGWGIHSFRKKGEQAFLTYELPYSHPSGIVWDGRGFWVSDWFSQSIYRHLPAPSLKTERVVHFPSWTPVGLTYAEGTLWSLNASGWVQKHLLNSELRVVSRYKTPASSPSAITYDGLYFWSADAQERILYKHLLDSQLTVLEKFAYPGEKPAGLYSEGKYLWSVDAATGELLQHDLKNPSQVLSRRKIPEYRTGRWRLGGFAGDGVSFWTVAEAVQEGREVSIMGRLFQHPKNGREP